MLRQELQAETRREIASREAANRAELRAKLAGLPQPENEYEVTVPELPEADEAGEGFEEDAADLAARKKLEAAAREAAELKKRSQVTATAQTLLLPASLPAAGLPELQSGRQRSDLELRHGGKQG